MKNIPLVLRLIIGAAVVAVIVLLVQEQRAASRAAGWDAAAVAARAGNTVEALEAAVATSKDTDAEPWLTFLLARQLCDQGGHDNLDRAHSLAQQALQRFPNHPAAADLTKVVQSTESLLKLSTS
jgi:hypothetical protein